MSRKARPGKPHNKIHFLAPSRIVFFLSAVVLVFNLLVVSMTYSSLRGQCLGILALVCMYVLLQGFETRKTHWTWGFVLAMSAAAFFFSAVLLFSLHNLNYCAMYCVELWIYLLICSLIFMIKAPGSEDIKSKPGKRIMVFKCKAHRFGCWFLCAGLVVVSVIFCIHINSDPLPVMVLLLVLLPLGPLLLYLGTWQLCLDAGNIHRRVFGLKSRSYSCHQIRHVRSTRYSNVGTQISITFTDGRVLRFETRDENAAQAVKWLKGHCSIMDSRK